MKKVAIKKAASQEMPRDVELDPGTTAYDILRHWALIRANMPSAHRRVKCFKDTMPSIPK